MRVLIVEDDSVGGILLEKAVSNEGHEAVWVTNGTQALERVTSSAFDALLVDLVLPGLDGISLMKVVREKVRPVPLLIVTTALSSPESRAKALEAGADDYLTKPYDPSVVLDRLELGLERRAQSQPVFRQEPPATPLDTPAFPLVALAAGSGGPTALRQIFAKLPEGLKCAFLVVQQAPAHILDTLLHLLRMETRLPVEMAVHGAPIRPGRIYLAPADRHIVVQQGPVLELNQEPMENYLRPSADPLFRSAARVFGSKCAAVVLSGLGIDGGSGAAQVAAAGGLVLAQDPAEALDPSMPNNVIQAGLTEVGLPLTELMARLARQLL